MRKSDYKFLFFPVSNSIYFSWAKGLLGLMDSKFSDLDSFKILAKRINVSLSPHEKDTCQEKSVTA